VSHTDTTLQFPLAHANAVSVFIRLWFMDDKISWLGGWASQWHPPQGLSEHKHCNNAATAVIWTARTLEAEWWQVCGEEWVRGKRKMSQVQGALGLMYFTMLRPVVAWSAFWNLWNVYFFNFPNIFSGRGQPRITETAYTESADTAVHLYLEKTELKQCDCSAVCWLVVRQNMVCVCFRNFQL